jgi:hypothetical protein
MRDYEDKQKILWISVVGMSITFLSRLNYIKTKKVLVEQVKRKGCVEAFSAGASRSWIRTLEQGIINGKYHCTMDLLFDWFVLVCFANKNINCQ